MKHHSDEEINNLVFGKNKTEKITSIEVDNGIVQIHLADGSMRADRHDYFMLWDRQLTDDHRPLLGDQDYKYFTKRETKQQLIQDIRWAKKYHHEYSVIYNDVEQYMVKNGVTYYKGMELSDLSVLSFDIETTGLKHDSESKTLLITNTYTDKLGKIQRKMFSYDKFPTEQDMILAWCKFVVALDPHIITGHNIIGYDLPYLTHCYGKKLPLGKGGRCLGIEKYTREFRKDGSQSYKYNNINIPGREIVDTWFLSMKYDVARKYPSYRLKEIIKHEGLEKEGRQYYDAASIKKHYKIPSEWEKIKSYAESDSDDSYNLFYLMCPAYFYYAQSVSKSFQEIILGATGSQINNIMVRSYLQHGNSIPKSSRVSYFEGGISFGNPGIYEHVQKVDVASMYPSVILDKSLYSGDKDPKCNLLALTSYFTTQRLQNKELYRSTSERKYKDLSEAQKIVINSIYGFLGCPGLSYNAPDIAATITREARNHLNKGIEWAKSCGYEIVNADTDSFMYTTGTFLEHKDFNRQIDILNTKFSDAIRWENDGQYQSVVIVKAKNYAMKEYGGKVTIKGSALKGTMKEYALQEYMQRMLDYLLQNNVNKLPDLYNNYVKEIKHLDDIHRWASKKTITNSVLNPSRTNESRVLDACKPSIQSGELTEGDKVRLFFKTATELEMAENFKGVYHDDTLYNKLFATLKIFANIVDVKQYKNFKLKRNKELLEEI